MTSSMEGCHLGFFVLCVFIHECSQPPTEFSGIASKWSYPNTCTSSILQRSQRSPPVMEITRVQISSIALTSLMVSWRGEVETLARLQNSEVPKNNSLSGKGKKGDDPKVLNSRLHESTC